MAVAVPIDTDKPCARCGYNLRGLMPDGQCPECSSAIAQSLRGNLLRFADAAWLDKLRLGTTLMIWNIVIIVIASIGASVMTGTFGLPPLLWAIIGLIGAAIGLAAAILVTSQEPAVMQTEDPLTLRRVVRLAAALKLLGDGAQIAGGYTGFPMIFAIVSGVLWLAGVVYLFGLLTYFRRLARRIPDEALAKSTRTLMLAMVICTTVSIALLFIIGLLSGGAGGRMTGMGCVFGVLMIVLFIWYIVTIVKYNNRFTDAAKFARSNEAVAFPVADVSPRD
jgi:hypothetical protein